MMGIDSLQFQVNEFTIKLLFCTLCEALPLHLIFTRC